MTIDMLAATVFRRQGERPDSRDPGLVDGETLPAEIPADGRARDAPAGLWSALVRNLGGTTRSVVPAAS